ncbi:MAG: hypothetical protein Q7T11_04985 [Deltaproteobacteria bacterium]|nr:hypothetical protein [Deltaproteobacteria bacterium]
MNITPILIYGDLSKVERERLFTQEERELIEKDPHFALDPEATLAESESLLSSFERAAEYLHAQHVAFRDRFDPHHKISDDKYSILRRRAWVIDGSRPSFDPLPFDPSPLFGYFHPTLDTETIVSIVAELPTVREYFFFDLYNSSWEENLGDLSRLWAHTENVHFPTYAADSDEELALFPSLDLGLMVFLGDYSDDQMRTFFQSAKDRMLLTSSPLTRRRFEVTEEYLEILLKHRDQLKNGEITLAEIVAKNPMPQVQANHLFRSGDIDFWRHYLAFTREGDEVQDTYLRRKKFLAHVTTLMEQSANSAPELVYYRELGVCEVMGQASIDAEILTILKNKLGVKIFFPAVKFREDVRPLMGADQAERILTRLKQNHSLHPAIRKEKWQEMFNSGDPEALADLAIEPAKAHKKGSLNYHQRDMAFTARERLIEELTIVLGPNRDVAAELRDSVLRVNPMRSHDQVVADRAAQTAQALLDFMGDSYEAAEFLRVSEDVIKKHIIYRRRSKMGLPGENDFLLQIADRFGLGKGGKGLDGRVYRPFRVVREALQMLGGNLDRPTRRGLRATKEQIIGRVGDALSIPKDRRTAGIQALIDAAEKSPQLVELFPQLTAASNPRSQGGSSGGLTMAESGLLLAEGAPENHSAAARFDVLPATQRNMPWRVGRFSNRPFKGFHAASFR